VSGLTSQAGLGSTALTVISAWTYGAGATPWRCPTAGTSHSRPSRPKVRGRLACKSSERLRFAQVRLSRPQVASAAQAGRPTFPISRNLLSGVRRSRGCFRPLTGTTPGSPGCLVSVPIGSTTSTWPLWLDEPLAWPSSGNPRTALGISGEQRFEMTAVATSETGWNWRVEAVSEPAPWLSWCELELVVDAMTSPDRLDLTFRSEAPRSPALQSCLQLTRA
jgi:hypothetical protein